MALLGFLLAIFLFFFGLLRDGNWAIMLGAVVLFFAMWRGRWLLRWHRRREPDSAERAHWAGAGVSLPRHRHKAKMKRYYLR